MAPLQGWHAKLRRVPYFLSRTTPIDRMGGEKSKNTKTLFRDLSLEPRHRSRHRNGFLLTSQQEKYQQHRGYFDGHPIQRSPVHSPYGLGVYILFRIWLHHRHDNHIFAIQILFASAVHILDMEQYREVKHGPMQGFHTILWGVLRFLSRTNPIDMIWGEKLRICIWKHYLGIRTQDQDIGTGIEMVSC